MTNVRTVFRRSPVVFGLATLAAIALVFISEGTYSKAVASLQRQAASQDVTFSLRELQSGLLDAESAQRGYLLTGRKEYLQPYAGGIALAGASLDALDQRYAATPEVAPTLEPLRTAAQSKLTELAQTIALYEAGQLNTATALIGTNVGLQQMDIIRSRASALIDIQTKIRAEGRAELMTTLALSRIGMATLSAVGLLALFLYLRQNAVVETYRLEIKRVAQGVSDSLEDEVRQRTAQLTRLTQHLQTAREDERNRLARNLHDELGALLTSAKLDAARIKSRLGGAAPEALERLAHLVETLNASIALGRSIIEDLRPSTLANLGLVAALEILARDFAEHSRVQVHHDLAPVKLTASAELTVYRLVQEAITNVSKYAKAEQVWIELASHGSEVAISVRDDGVGFDADAQAGSAYGLVGMRFRVEAERGVLTVVSAPGQGTRVQARLPAAA
jgi:signal transduction histidine kinase